MPQMLCANPECNGHKEAKGGKFIYRDGKWMCEDCDNGGRMPEYHGDSLWDFKTMNLGADPNKGPIHVKSMRHLSRLEQQHGASSVALNMDSKNWGNR
jgi:hypothetical protein